MTYPIPTEAFDDRLAVTGISGSGKTYSVLGALGRLMKERRRFIAADALGVMYGLRLKADGVTPSEFKPVIFGGPHGDLPLTVAAAPLLGEAAAGMAESVILDMSQLGTKAAERRFMLGFLRALERHANREPVHLIFDEADLWAPQKIFDKEGETMKLLGVMDNIVRRGRIKGFIPWLITQRPAVLSKDVLSQVDGVIAMKLTGSQDRDAIGAWIEGQADRAKGKEILALLPTMTLGEGVIWIPGRQVLKTAKFPQNVTFDSSRTPRRGESARRVDLKPLDLGKLKDRLAMVEEEAKANDPAALKAQVAQLTGDLAKARKAPAAAPAPAKDDARAMHDQERAFIAGQREGHLQGWEDGWASGYQIGFRTGFPDAQDKVRAALKSMVLDPGLPTIPKPPKSFKAAAMPTAIMSPAAVTAARASSPGPIQLFPSRQLPSPGASVPVLDGDLLFQSLPKPKRRILEAVQFWRTVGTEAPTRVQVGGVAGYRQTGDFRAAVGSLVTAGFLAIPDPGKLSLADGSNVPPIDQAEARVRLISILSGPQKKILTVALGRPGQITRADLGASAGYAQTGDFRAAIGFLCSMNILTKPSDGVVEVSPWARQVLV